MKKTTIILAGALLAFGAAAADSTASKEAGLTFYCSFNGKTDADFAAGDGKGKVTAPADSTLFASGVKNQGLVVGSKNSKEGKVKVIFKAPGNISAKEGTAVFWFKPENWNEKDKNHQLFVSMQGAKGHFFCLYKTGQTALRFYEQMEGKAKTVRADRQLKQGEWHHFAAVWTEDMLKLYIDGKAINPVQRLEGDITDFSTIVIGALDWSPIGGYTVIDELKIYNRPMKADEIAGLIKK